MRDEAAKQCVANLMQRTVAEEVFRLLPVILEPTHSGRLHASIHHPLKSQVARLAKAQQVRRHDVDALRDLGRVGYSLGQGGSTRRRNSLAVEYAPRSVGLPPRPSVHDLHEWRGLLPRGLFASSHGFRMYNASVQQSSISANSKEHDDTTHYSASAKQLMTNRQPRRTRGFLIRGS